MTFRESLVQYAESRVNSAPISTSPFPQADSIDRIIELSKLLTIKPMGIDGVADALALVGRQSSYYLNACRYLGLIEKKKVGKDTLWSASTIAMKIFAKDKDFQIKQICLLLLSIDSCAKIFLRLQSDIYLSKSEIFTIFDRSEDSLYCTGETTKRRATTVGTWARWVDAIAAEIDN
jgi:hypothetical protein